MTNLEIEAQRTRDYKFLGRFLGLAEMAESNAIRTPLILEEFVCILREYRDGDADDIAPGDTRYPDPARTSAHGRPGWNG